ATLGMGLTAASLTAMTGTKFNNEENILKRKTMAGDAEEFFNKIKGEHRVVYDGSTPHMGLPIVWNFAFLMTNNQTGVEDSNMTAVTVLRHDAVPYAMEDRLWEKYKLGEFFKVTDNNTGRPAMRNTVYMPKGKDMPLPIIEGIKDLQKRGSLFCVCDLALNVYSGFIAEQQGLKQEEVYADFKGGLLPEIQLVPSGVWALERAQKKGCAYIFAGE
ncbi:MAG: Tat (twin-arginine translocation) pathway signal sequence containing protein, partial [Flavobacteriaceae bacterium]|nr:Tat (twin-arginine translocation) pathway signal sequence containing protein [Flavobacteriaceae bacterium]